MRCPTCKGETIFEGNPFRPFCSERCKMIDLDNWLSGRYRISTPVDRPEEAVNPEADAGGPFGDSDGRD
jgi:endogenous inhibitor of DNA gyrase (YacG/DUF329 family)